MTKSKEFALSRIHVDSDSKILIDSMNGKLVPEIYCDLILEDIHEMAASINCMSFSFMPKTCNTLAHEIARGPDLLCFQIIPANLVSLVCKDTPALVL